MNTKICHVCKQELPITEFYLDRRKTVKKETRQSRCKQCRNKYNQERKEKWDTKLYARRANKKKMGLTLEEFESRLEKQKNLCAICGLPETDYQQYGVKNLAIDHNHRTKKVRGLLCSKCNRALGLLNVDNLGILNLQMAIKYLQEAT